MWSLSALVLCLFVTSFSGCEAFFNLNSVKKSFTTSDCGQRLGQNAAIRFNQVSVTPEPITLPGTIRIAVNIDIVRNISQTLSADITVKRRLNLGWFGYSWFDVTPPCIPSAVQGCRTDLCDVINSVVQTEGCPAEVIDNGFTCACPPNTGSYVTRSNLPLVVQIRESDLPLQLVRDLIQGTYKVTTEVYDGSGSIVGCLETIFGLLHNQTP
ncbi:uncharacterized protein LOC121406128 [Lytechinus variegatus]|uniref:uncharacterized protein LOC121406128 n=1 Tax=Lytechinus variegatus TaxID=7654 RepID=UPI001BB250D6|nr:uncharacterized protein LOC121406128 [Lytechinus variegatus]